MYYPPESPQEQRLKQIPQESFKLIVQIVFGLALEQVVPCNLATRRVPPSKLKHIFGQARHNLDDLVRQFGSELKAFEAIQEATEAVVRNRGLTGIFETSVKVGTQKITVRGKVIEGVVKIGTAFKP